MSFAVQGWCPGALRPMAAGDGLVLRVRPRNGRITPAQAEGIARAARTYGNGLIDLSGRANLQLRGVTPENHASLLNDLAVLGLIDPDLSTEARRNVIVTPFADARTDALADQLLAALPTAPDLPGKFGFMLDCGPAPCMRDTPADIRLERAADGRLLLRAAGMERGAPVAAGEAAGAMIALARWFVEAGGITGGRGRMAALIGRGARLEGGLAGTILPAPAIDPPGPGRVARGMLFAFAFGQMPAETFAALGRLGPLRITPWRMVLVEGLAELPFLEAVITDPDDPLLHVHACTGAPDCIQAAGATRPLARRLAARMPRGRGQLVHISGCAKGCAWPAAAPITLVATSEGYDLIRDGTAAAPPVVRALDEMQVLDMEEFD